MRPLLSLPKRRRKRYVARKRLQKVSAPSVAARFPCPRSRRRCAQAAFTRSRSLTAQGVVASSRSLSPSARSFSPPPHYPLKESEALSTPVLPVVAPSRSEFCYRPTEYFVNAPPAWAIEFGPSA